MKYIAFIRSDAHAHARAKKKEKDAWESWKRQVRRRDNERNYAGHCERRNILHSWENFLPPRFFHLCADHGFCIPFIERCIHNGAYIAVSPVRCSM